jgi:tape measure domain-containing protein
VNTADEWAGIRVYMQDRARFQRDAEAVASSTDRMGNAANRFGGSTENAARRSFLMNQAMFTMRRLAYGPTLALGTLASTGLALGVKFDASLEMSKVAMTQFLGSEQAAADELAYLYKLAKFTPFTFSDITDAATQFFAFGYSVKQTNDYLRILGDTIAGLGLAGDDVKRIAIVFGQIRASGRLLGQDLLQLTQARIPALEILADQLNLSRAQQQALLAGSLRIPADVAIPALMRGMQERFGGLAAKQSRTFTGQLSTLRDNLTQFLGQRTQGLFEWLRTNALPTLNQMFDDFQRGRGPLADFARLWQQGVAPGLRIAFIVLAPLLPLLHGTADVMTVLSHHTTLVKIGIGLLTTALLINAGAWLLLSIRSALAGASLARLIGRLAAARLATALYTLAVRSSIGAMVAARIAALATAYTLARVAGAGRLAALGIVLFNSALLANPIVLIIAAIVAAIAVFALLYWKVDFFRRGVNAAFDWIKTNWPLLLAILASPIALAIAVIVRNFGRIKSAALDVFNYVRRLFARIGDVFDAVWKHVPGHSVIDFAAHHIGIPGLASGGTITSPGPVLVGERGPELLSLSRGATVQPLTAEALPPISLSIIDDRPIELYIDGERFAVAVTRNRAARAVLAEGTAQSTLQRGARK